MSRQSKMRNKAMIKKQLGKGPGPKSTTKTNKKKNVWWLKFNR